MRESDRGAWLESIDDQASRRELPVDLTSLTAHGHRTLAESARLGVEVQPILPEGKPVECETRNGTFAERDGDAKRVDETQIHAFEPLVRRHGDLDRAGSRLVEIDDGLFSLSESDRDRV